MSYDLVVIWRVLDQCNLGCPFCEYRKDLRFKRIVTDLEKVLNFGQVLVDYSQATGRKILISWLGGEPFLWKHIISASETFRRGGIHISTTTNGTRFVDDTVIEQTARIFSEITFSIDGNGSSHDIIRRQNGLFQSVRESIKKLHSARKNHSDYLLNTIRVNTVLNGQSILEFENFCNLLAEIGVDEISFNQLIADKESGLYQQYGLTSKNISVIRAIQKLQSVLLDKHGLKLLGAPIYFDRIIDYINDIPVPVTDCNPGSRFLFIDQFGNVGPCSFLTALSGINISDIDSQEKISELPMLFRSLIAKQQPLACQNCMDTNVFGKFQFPLRPSVSSDKLEQIM